MIEKDKLRHIKKKNKPRPRTSASFTLRVSSSLRQLSEQPLCSHWISETESMTVTGGARACMPTDSKSGLSSFLRSQRIVITAGKSLLLKNYPFIGGQWLFLNFRPSYPLCCHLVRWRCFHEFLNLYTT